VKGSRFILGLFALLIALAAWLAWMIQGALARNAALAP